MSPLGKYYVGAAVVAVIAFILPIPLTLSWLIALGVLGAPIVAYFMLDSSQRKRLKRIRRRSIGR